jgi:class 3 adenylate cyclase
MRQATLDIQQRLNPEFRLSFCTGIHTGKPSWNWWAPTSGWITAIGDSINTAKRLQQSAGPGQVLISQEVYTQIAAHVIATPVEPIQAKGKKHPIQVYEVIALKESCT